MRFWTLTISSLVSGQLRMAISVMIQPMIGQSKLENHTHPEDSRGARIRGLRHRGGVAQQRNSTGSNHGGKRGDEFIDQAVGAGDNGGDITPAAVELKVNGIGHVEVLEVVMHMLEPFCSRDRMT